MNTFLQCDWNDILKGKYAGQQFDIIMTKFNEAKNKHTPHMNTKASNKAKKHNYIPLDAKSIQKKGIHNSVIPFEVIPSLRFT
jgi:hypothetical protein